jgi:hypothetical protein
LTARPGIVQLKTIFEMQNNTNSPDFPTQNPFSEHFAKFGNTRLFDRLQNKFTPKPYYFQYRTLRAVVLGASFIFHILSAATAAALVFLFIGKLIPSPALAAVVTLAALVALELAKRETSGRFFHDLLQYGKFAPGLLAVVLGLSAASIACSYFGAEKAVRELTPPPTLVNGDTVTAPIRAQLAAIDGQINDAKRNTWKGKVTTRAQQTIDRLTRQREALTNEMIRQQTRTDTRNDATETEHVTTTEANANGFALFTLCSEILLIVCLWYLQFYDFRSFAEYCAKPAAKKPEAIGFNHIQPAAFSANGNGHHNGGNVAQGYHTANEEPPRRPIGFHRPPDDPNGMRYRARDNGMSYDSTAAAPEVLEVDKSLKPCAQCGTRFRYRTTWQKFCTNDCKLAYHEAKHGRKFDPTYKKKPKAVTA